MGKTPLQSKTIKFHLFMVAVQSVNGSLASFTGMISPETMIIAAASLGLMQSVGGIYLRFITEEPIK